MSLITLKNVKKEYGKNQVLFENLSLEIEKGEFVGLVGCILRLNSAFFSEIQST